MDVMHKITWLPIEGGSYFVDARRECDAYTYDSGNYCTHHLILFLHLLVVRIIRCSPLEAQENYKDFRTNYY